MKNQLINKGQKGTIINKPKTFKEYINSVSGKTQSGYPSEQGLNIVSPEFDILLGGKALINGALSFINGQDKSTVGFDANKTLKNIKDAVVDAVEDPAYTMRTIKYGIRDLGDKVYDIGQNIMQRRTDVFNAINKNIKNIPENNPIEKGAKFFLKSISYGAQKNPALTPTIVTGKKIIKGQAGMYIPPSYVNESPFVNRDDIRLKNGVSLPWEQALQKTLDQPTTNEMFDPEIKQLYGMQDKVGKYAKKLLDAGYTPQQTAGVLGSLYQESKFNPSMKQNRGKGFGLAQWTTGDVRYHQLANLARSMNLPITNDDVQMNYLINELNGSNRQHIENAWGGRGRRETFINNSDTIPNSSKNFTNLFLRAGNANMKRRQQYSEEIYSIMKNLKLVQ